MRIDLERLILAMMIDLIRKHAAPVPRYTSYPTALSFTNDVTEETYATWLAQLSVQDTISLYLHIPFCNSICWYCGCHAKGTRKREPVARYLKALEAEIELVSARTPMGIRVNNLHWGGGSPNSLSPEEIRQLAHTLKAHFHISNESAFAVEIDPRSLTEAQSQAFAEVGVNRASLGVQDFDADVQAAIGRIQSFDVTRTAAENLRRSGITSLNIDLVYGLPRQTRDSAERTMDGVLELNPDRIALFGYAHLPAKIKRQRLVDETNLPGSEKRFALANRMASRLTAAGYVRVGLDHFARPEDPLSVGPIRRNFQGYTTDTSSALIGLGATAIGQMPDGYVQNAISVAEYERRIQSGKLATQRGYELTKDDRIRAFVIERLMCDLAFPARALCEHFGAKALHLIEDARELVKADSDGLVEPDGSGFRVTEKGRPFLRSIAACFDQHTNIANNRFSVGV